jgi:hypothetical protein
LRADGVRIWHSLLGVLVPDIILISVAAEHLNEIQFPLKSLDQVLFTIERNRPYRVLGRFLTTSSSKSSLLVFGRAAHTPFGTVSKLNKREIGAAIKEWYCASER